MFPSTSSRETLRISGKQNSLFPSGAHIKCILYPVPAEGGGSYKEHLTNLRKLIANRQSGFRSIACKLPTGCVKKN